MAAKKTGDPRDGEQHAGGARFMPVHGVFGTGVVVPGPLTPGPPKPEPEERWTLGPGRHHEPATPTGPDVDPVAEDVSLEPVRSRVARPTGQEGEADPS